MLVFSLYTLYIHYTHTYIRIKKSKNLKIKIVLFLPFYKIRPLCQAPWPAPRVKIVIGL